MTASARTLDAIAVQPDVTVDPAARFDAIFEAHHDAAWRTMRRLGVSERSIDDAIQRVFVVVAKKLDTILVGGEGKFVYGVAIRVASEMRRRDPARREVSGDEIVALIADDAPGPEESLLEHEARRALDEALAGMPDDLREVLVLVEIEGVPVNEVAELLSVPVGTAHSRLRRAREAFTQSARRVRARLGGAR